MSLDPRALVDDTDRAGMLRLKYRESAHKCIRLCGLRSPLTVT